MILSNTSSFKWCPEVHLWQVARGQTNHQPPNLGEWLQVATNQCATLVNFLQSSVLGPRCLVQPLTLHSSWEIHQVDLCIAAFAHCAPLQPKSMTWDSKSPLGSSMPVNDPLPCNQANTTMHWHILDKVCMWLYQGWTPGNPPPREGGVPRPALPQETPLWPHPAPPRKNGQNRGQWGGKILVTPSNLSNSGNPYWNNITTLNNDYDHDYDHDYECWVYFAKFTECNANLL